LAQPVDYVTPETIFNITCKVYGNATTPIKLFEDNPYNFDFEKGNYNWLQISCDGNKATVIRNGNYSRKLYEVSESVERVE
jgi:alpha-D-xyloside xylohydrolase